jgi:inosine-uridine nucleoside N-ribohydrolase
MYRTHLLSVAVLCGSLLTPAFAALPVVYSTDLYYTIHDIDDHFDAAVLLKSPELDVRGIVLDSHKPPSDGDRVLDRIMGLAGRRVPVVKGLGGFEMRSLTDQGRYVDGQGGVELVLKTLRDSTDKVALIAVGSMTDFAVAYLREPDLLLRKTAKLYIVAGRVQSHTLEWNVKLDPAAFVVLMRSKVPIVWVPCDSSQWYFPAPKMLAPARNLLSHFLLNELVYWYIRNDFRTNTYKDRYEYYEMGRWMWSTPAFVDAVGHPDAAGMFELSPARAEFTNGGILNKIEYGAANANLRVVTSVNGDRLNEFIVSRINR